MYFWWGLYLWIYMFSYHILVENSGIQILWAKQCMMSFCQVNNIFIVGCGFQVIKPNSTAEKLSITKKDTLCMILYGHWKFTNLMKVKY